MLFWNFLLITNETIFDDFQDSLLYVFKYDGWFIKIWPLLLVPFLPVIGILAVFLLKGWRFEMVKNLAFNRNDLPKVDIVLWLKRGFILWGSLLVYLLVPWILCRLIGVAGFIDMVSDLHILISEGSGAYFEDYLKDLLITLIIYGVWGVLSAPTFQCGMVRYVISDDWKCLFAFLPNLYFVLRHSFIFFKFFAMWFIFVLLVLVLDSVLAATFVGAILIPLVTITFFYVSTAYELGELAVKIRGIEIERTSSESVNMLAEH